MMQKRTSNLSPPRVANNQMPQSRVHTGKVQSSYQLTGLLLFLSTATCIWYGTSSVGDRAHSTVGSNIVQDVTISVKDADLAESATLNLARAKQEFLVQQGRIETPFKTAKVLENKTADIELDKSTVELPLNIQHGRKHGKQAAADKSDPVTEADQAHHATVKQEVVLEKPANLASPATDEGTPVDTCHASSNTEYDGAVVKWGADNFQESAGDCCKQCQSIAGCNIWVWCGLAQGCGGDRKHKECWLKRKAVDLLELHRSSHPAIPWTSGALYNDGDMKAVVAAEANRLQGLRDDLTLPLVWLDVSIAGVHVGRIQMVLFTKESPRAAENFRQLCTGEKGTVPSGHEGEGLQYHFKGKAFYRIIDRFIDQTGAGTESVFGGYFKDDAGGLKLKHNRKGLLSMANAGRDQNSSHFSILMSPAPHLDGSYTIFGEVVNGFEVAEKINLLARGKPDNHAGMEAGAIITDAGQTRCGQPCGLPTSTASVR